MHPTIQRIQEVIASGDDTLIEGLLAEDVTFLPPTYWATWTGREPVAMLLGHVGKIFTEFRYRRILGEGKDWILEFQCKVGDLDAVGVDLLTLDDDGLIQKFEVAIRPYKTVKALREAMNARVMSDPRFLKHKDAVTRG
ncbi:hypothetical protein SAMN05444000_101125 [Shimia gijangensis]|uniref:SnoaL-like domain-containing protein n=1 Tax=Shimia gijangensis TaxID=1470563 RepID=A0A1M6B4V4_9RHOB|nr:hypothetical protein [Shimia gijangensis]SHI43687.1 hypothetical protein SAMN05444000_101125 [Shimia gijangensis]